MRHNQGDRRFQTPTGGPAVRGSRGLLAWLTLALLALNILASGVLPVRLDGGTMPMGAALVGAADVGDVGRGAIDCAPDGTGDHGSGTPVQPHTHDSFCIFCLPLMHGAVDVPGAMAVPPPRRTGAVRFAALRVAAPRPHAILAAWPRGPPILPA